MKKTFMDVDKNKIDKNTAYDLLEKFKKKFVAPDYDRYNQKIFNLKRSWLLNCNLSCKVEIISTENFESIPLNKNTKVYFYDERDNKMYKTLFSEICEFIAGFEPWDEIDAEIFDDSFEWFIAISHEDISLIHGLSHIPGSMLYNKPFYTN
ncbi:MAG: hypothetical protein IJZ64_04350 [Ruminococcus sp.]|nr:hypothetical protein [Ruminococcus sp.]